MGAINLLSSDLHLKCRALRYLRARVPFITQSNRWAFFSFCTFSIPINFNAPRSSPAVQVPQQPGKSRSPWRVNSNRSVSALDEKSFETRKKRSVYTTPRRLRMKPVGPFFSIFGTRVRCSPAIIFTTDPPHDQPPRARIRHRRRMFTLLDRHTL